LTPHQICVKILWRSVKERLRSIVYKLSNQPTNLPTNEKVPGKNISRNSSPIKHQSQYYLLHGTDVRTEAIKQIFEVKY